MFTVPSPDELKRKLCFLISRSDECPFFKGLLHKPVIEEFSGNPTEKKYPKICLKNKKDQTKQHAVLFSFVLQNSNLGPNRTKIPEKSK